MRFYEKVNELCIKKGISITALATELGFSKGTPTNWKTMTKPPRAENVKKIADYFGVSPTYFTDENSVNIQSINDNHGVIGHANAPITIINGSEKKLTNQEIELLNIFNKLDIVKQAKMLVFASELEKEDKK